MVQLSNEELQSRYELLCKATQPNSSLNIELQRELSKLEKLITHDLVELTRDGCPDNITDILQAFDHELTRFRQFCEFPDLATKSIVGVGGGFSAGKSTFINTLLTEKVLPVESDATTSVPTYIVKGKKSYIKALNLHRSVFDLSKEEFNSLTHEELDIYGSQINRLFESTILSSSIFKWDNLALIDTPGYSKYENLYQVNKSDEDIARKYLNQSDCILWLVPIEKGTIPEQDIDFLRTLDSSIPKVIILSKSELKSEDDVNDIIDSIKFILLKNEIEFLDVMPFSRKGIYNNRFNLFLDELDTSNNPLLKSKTLFNKYLRYVVKHIQLLEKEMVTKGDVYLSDISNKNIELYFIDLRADLNKFNGLLDSIRTIEKSYFHLLSDLGNMIDNHFIEPCVLDALLFEVENDVSEYVFDRFEKIFSGDCAESEFFKLKYVGYSDGIYNSRLNVNNKHQGVYIHILFVLSVKLMNLNDKQLTFLQTLLVKEKLSSDINNLILDVSEEQVDLFFNALSADSGLMDEFISIILATYWFGSQDDIDCLSSNPLNSYKISRNAINIAWITIITNTIIGDKERNYFINHENSQVRAIFALNKSLCDDHVNILANDTVWFVRRALASVINSDAIDVLLSLAKDESIDVRVMLAENKNVPVRIQLILAEDSIISVRQVLANNPIVDIEVQEKLAKSKYTNSDLACNSNIFPTVQEIILEQNEKNNNIFLGSSVEYISSNVSISLLSQSKVLDYSNIDAIKSLAINPSLHRDIQHRIANNEVPGILSRKGAFSNGPCSFIDYHLEEVRAELAQNPSLVKDVQLILSEDDSQMVRERLVKNPYLIEELQLFFSNDWELRSYLLDNKGLTPATLRKNINILFEDFDEDDFDGYEIESLLKNSNFIYSDSYFEQMSDILSHELDLDILINVFVGSSCCERVKSSLLNDDNFKNWLEKFELSNNDNISNNQAKKLLDFNDIHINVSLSKNRFISEEIMLSLLDFSDSLASNLSLTDNVYSRLLELPACYETLASNENIPLWVQKELVAYNEYGTSCMHDKLAKNVNISYEVQRILIDKGISVEMLASNLALHIDNQKILAKNKSCSVRAEIISNPIVNSKIKETMYIYPILDDADKLSMEFDTSLKLFNILVGSKRFDNE
ncbi:dynamin family protein [Vibrio rotiferianus]|uniref:dynamin family protein n=1 Tax=Vibrio rotiferianus TaxID=190895 RepID=UPI002490F93E|nr:dynamin family protein [Vibrio rotiferianus]